MSYFIPADSMTLLRQVFSDLMATRNSGFLSFGIVGTIWTASGASAALIEALNVAYGVKEGRPFWHTRLLAIGLTVALGTLVAVVLAAMFLGPIIAVRVAHRVGLDPLFTQSWLYFRWVVALCFSVLAIEIVYYLAPNVEQRKFWRTVPGSIVAVTAWIGASYAFGFYVQHVGNLSKSYGTLGAVAGLLLWFYLSSAAILVGAELNAELLKAAHEKLPVKEAPNGSSEKHVDVWDVDGGTRYEGTFDVQEANAGDVLNGDISFGVFFPEYYYHFGYILLRVSQLIAHIGRILQFSITHSDEAHEQPYAKRIGAAPKRLVNQSIEAERIFTCGANAGVFLWGWDD
jgi:membrane protein